MPAGIDAPNICQVMQDSRSPETCISTYCKIVFSRDTICRERPTNIFANGQKARKTENIPLKWHYVRNQNGKFCDDAFFREWRSNLEYRQKCHGRFHHVMNVDMFLVFFIWLIIWCICLHLFWYLAFICCSVKTKKMLVHTCGGAQGVCCVAVGTA